jgi:hypothetical protein
MIKNFISYILFLMLCCTCFCFKAGAQEFQAIAKLDQTAIRIGDQTKLHLTVYQHVKQQISFPVIADTLNSKIQVTGSSKQDTIPDQNDPDHIAVTKTLIITGFDAGTYTIPAFVFTGKEGTVKTNELSLLVQSVKVDTTKNIYDIKQPLAVSYTFADWIKDNWQWVLFPLLAALLIAGAVYYLIRNKKKKPLADLVKPGLPAHIIALNQLTELRDKKLWQQEKVKEYYSELSDVLREYLEKRYSIKTQERTTDEIFESLEKVGLAAKSKNTLHQLLTTADLVKFAKEKPSAPENEQCITDAISFVSDTKKTESLHPENNVTGTAGHTKEGGAGEHI